MAILETRIDRDVAYITFNRPEVLNALNEAMHVALGEMLNTVRPMPLKALVFRGTGRAFSVGLDAELLERAFSDHAYFEMVIRRFNGFLLGLEALDFPVISAVNGYARAGGYEIALASDLVIIADEAKIGDNHTNVGLLPGGGATQRAPRKIGDQRARELIYTGRWLTGSEAAAWGLALRSVPLVDLDNSVEELLDQLRAIPREGVTAAKRAINAGRDLPLAAGIDREIAVFLDHLRTYPDARASFDAFFAEKRARERLDRRSANRILPTLAGRRGQLL